MPAAADTDVTTRTTNLSSGVFDISPGSLTFGDLDGPGPLTGIQFVQDQYMNGAMYGVQPDPVSCTYGGYSIAAGVALQSVVRFTFSSVPAPTATVLLLGALGLGALRRVRSAARLA